MKLIRVLIIFFVGNIQSMDKERPPTNKEILFLTTLQELHHNHYLTDDLYKTYLKNYSAITSTMEMRSSSILASLMHLYQSTISIHEFDKFRTYIISKRILLELQRDCDLPPSPELNNFYEVNNRALQKLYHQIVVKEKALPEKKSYFCCI